MKEKLSTAPFPADSSVICESGGIGAAIMYDLEPDNVSWPSDGEMTVLRVKARGQSILGDGGHLCWPAAPRVQRPIPPSGAAVVTENTGSLVNLATLAPDAAPDGEALLVPLSSWSAKSVNLSDSIPLPLPSTRMSPPSNPLPMVAAEAAGPQITVRHETSQADFSRPASPRPSFWRGFISKLCCGGGTDSR